MSRLFVPFALGLSLLGLAHAHAQVQTRSETIPAIAPPDAQGAAGTQVGCGLLGTGSGPTPEGMDIFPAAITQINGERPRMGRPLYRLAPGRHVLVVAESIPPHHLGTAQQTQIARMKQRKDFSGYFKPLVVDVQADTLQRVGVRLVRERLDTAGIRENAYWEPVVWEQVPRECL